MKREAAFLPNFEELHVSTMSTVGILSTKYTVEASTDSSDDI